jgi:hypothetical protein
MPTRHGAAREKNSNIFARLSLRVTAEPSSRSSACT